VNAPSSLSGEFQGGSATLTFIPADDSGGAMTYSGGGSGVTVSGDGTYTIVDDGDGALSPDRCVSSQTTHATVVVPEELCHSPARMLPG
jgi:hypothetical protein